MHPCNTVSIKTYWLPVLKEKKTKGEDETKKGEDAQMCRRGQGSSWKNRQPCSTFSQPSHGEQERVRKVSCIFVDVWSEPKGPPLQGHIAIKHSEMKCLMGGDMGGRGGGKSGCSQASRMKAGGEAWWGRRRWLGCGLQMHKGYSGFGGTGLWQRGSRSWQSQSACSQMTNTIIYE